MDTIENLIKDLKALPEMVADGVDRAMLGDSFDIAGINKDQLEDGEDREGIKLGDYAAATKAIRSKRGLQTRHIDLRFTGRSYNSITVRKKTGTTYFMDAKPRWDVKRFPDAIGIAEKNEDVLTGIIVLNIEALLNEKFT